MSLIDSYYYQTRKLNSYYNIEVSVFSKKFTNLIILLNLPIQDSWRPIQSQRQDGCARHSGLSPQEGRIPPQAFLPSTADHLHEGPQRPQQDRQAQGRCRPSLPHCHSHETR